MKRLFLFLLFMSAVAQIYSFSSFYVGWENFISPALPEGSKTDVLKFGIYGNTPSRVFFSYGVYGHGIYVNSPTSSGNLGWGFEMMAGIGYRFTNPAFLKSGLDTGLEAFAYFNPNFLNSEIGYTETAYYYGVGLGGHIVYKISPYFGLGLRASMKYNIGTVYVASQSPSTPGLLFNVGVIFTF